MARAISAMGSFSPVLECTQVTATILVRGRTALTSVSTRLSVTLRKSSYRGIRRSVAPVRSALSRSEVSVE